MRIIMSAGIFQDIVPGDVSQSNEPWEKDDSENYQVNSLRSQL